MPTIVEVSVFYRIRETDKLESIDIVPKSQEASVIKLQVAQVVRQLREEGKAEYYYVTVKAAKDSGGYGYRTIVPKTML